MKQLPEDSVQLLGTGAVAGTSTAPLSSCCHRRWCRAGKCAARSPPVIDTVISKFHITPALRSIQEVINCPVLNGGNISKGIKAAF